MDLLGHLREKIRDKRHPDQKGDFQTEGRYAPALLLGRLPPSLKIISEMKIPEIVVYKKEDFRRWLDKNHLRKNKVALILHKRHTGAPAPTHRELIEEAICFGWIDTTIKRIDEHTFLRNFSKRTGASRWSDNTLRYARDLIKKGLMTREGMKFYRLGLAKPTHDHGIPKNPEMPDELKKALSGNEQAGENFQSLSPSLKRTYYRWILRAKLPETRDKRIKQIVRSVLSWSKNFLGPNTKVNN